MSRTLVTFRSLVVVLAAGILLPVAVSAQGTSYTKSAPPRSPAEQLESMALQSKVQDGDWIEAAQALEQAAKIRGAIDARAVNDLLGAAAAFQIAGKLTQARRAAVAAARHAFQTGDAYTAAAAYMAAVKLSVDLNDPDGASRNLEHAKQLAESPRVTPEQKRSLFIQMGYPVDRFCKK